MLPAFLRHIFTNVFIGLIVWQCFYLSFLRDLLPRWSGQSLVRPGRKISRHFPHTSGAEDEVETSFSLEPQTSFISQGVKVVNEEASFADVAWAELGDESTVACMSGASCLFLLLSFLTTVLGMNLSAPGGQDILCGVALGFFLVIFFFRIGTISPQSPEVCITTTRRRITEQ